MISGGEVKNNETVEARRGEKKAIYSVDFKPSLGLYNGPYIISASSSCDVSETN